VNTENIVVHNLQHVFNYPTNATLPPLSTRPRRLDKTSFLCLMENNHNFTVPEWLSSHLQGPF